jgi:alanyl-tRNA synthetase
VGGFALHIGRIRSGCLKVGDTVTASLAPSRQQTMQNHTATHLANWALREVLGEGVQQKGSLVDPEKLRFDFSHGKSLSEDEIARTEKFVTEKIGAKLPVYAEQSPQDQALKINGLRAVFGEKYPPMVRVVSIGAAVPQLLSNPGDPKWRSYSIEFCGGTHVGNSSDISNFVVTSEESVSKGVRRIVAHTGMAASAAAESGRGIDANVTKLQSLPEEQLPAALNALQKSFGGEGIPLLAKRRAQAAITELQSKYRAWEKSQKKESSSIDVGSVANDLLKQAPIIVSHVDGASDEQLRAVLDSIKKRATTFGVMLGATDGQKVTFVAAVSDDLIAKGLKAGDWIRETAKVAGGGGGGRPQMAQAGGKNPEKLPEALETARKFAANSVK